MTPPIVTAYLEVRNGFSADRVVADPALNSKFIERCRARGLEVPEVELNCYLLNARKAGRLKGLPRSKRTSFSDEEAYRYASEVAARYLEQHNSTTLDRIICDPSLACQLDAIAANIAPGYSSLRYRWAALNLRKAHRLRPELLSRIVEPMRVEMGSVENVRPSELPNEQGIYVFYGPTDTLYVGEGSNLQRRIGKHLDHSDNKNLARWFWSNGFNDVRLEIHVLAKGTPARVRKALESELISSRHPLFNIQQVHRNPRN